jgi:hypothetical protein
MARGGIGENDLALGAPGKRVIQHRVGLEPAGDIHIMDEIEIILRVHLMMANEAAEGHTIIGPVTPPQSIDLADGNADHIAHVEVDPLIQQGKKVLFAGINRIVEIKNKNVRHVNFIQLVIPLRKISD